MFIVDEIKVRWLGPKYEVVWFEKGLYGQTTAFFYKYEHAVEYCKFKNSIL